MLVIGNGRLVIRDSEQPFFESGAVVMDGTTIRKVGTLEEIKKESHDTEYVDAERGVIIPAFINTHEHICNAMARGLPIRGYDPKGFPGILDGMWWTINRHLTGEQIRRSAKVTYLDSIKSGVTTVFDHHANFREMKDLLFAIKDAAKKVGARTYLYYRISDRDGMDKVRAAVMENTPWIKHALTDDTDMIAGMMGMHTQFAISDGTMEPAVANKPAEMGYHIHVAEGIEDLHGYLKKYGKRAVDRPMNRNILGEKTLLIHCIYINPHEMQPIRDMDTMMVHNPESNMGNTCGCPPTMEIVHRGILTGLGTDGYTHDMTESFKVASALHKHHLCDVNATWGEVPQMFLEGNARIANRYFKKQLGVLKEDVAVDVIVTNYILLTPTDVSNINDHVLFGMTGRSAVTAICNGKALMKDREPVGLDEEKTLYRVREKAKKLAHPING